MSVGMQVHMSRTVSTCDRCGRTDEGEMVHGRAPAYRLPPRLLAAGWRTYVSRHSSTRDYCPNCEPSRGHRMRLVAGSEPRP